MGSLDFLDLFIIAVLVISIIMFLTGNGDTMIGLFSGKQARQDDIYDKEKLNRASLILCVVLLADELALLFLRSRFPKIGLLTTGITLAAFIIYVWYLKKHASK